MEMVRARIIGRGGALALAASLALASCARRDESAATSPPPAAATPAPPPPSPAKPAGPSFRDNVVSYLSMNCAITGCHGEKATIAVNLDLRPASAYASLVNHAAESRAGAMRVKPGDPDGSFLIAKLTGKLGPREGKPMPLDPSTGKPLPTVPADPRFIDTILRPWIQSGAPNN